LSWKNRRLAALDRIEEPTGVTFLITIIIAHDGDSEDEATIVGNASEAIFFFDCFV
jgi:hypothetical protein